MNVLHVYRTFFPDTQGGLEETIRQICIATREHGVTSRVLCLSRKPAEPFEWEGIGVYQAKLNFEVASCGVSAPALKMHDQLLEWADVVNYHFPWPFADILYLWSRKNRKPTVITYHSDIVRQRVLGIFYSPLMHKFLDSADTIVCTSPNYFATSPVLSQHAKKVSVIPLGIDSTTYPEVEPEFVESTRVEYGEDFFLFVGVLRYYKGLHILLDAIKGARFKVIIVGSGPIESSLKKQAEELGLNNVTFAGRLDNDTKVALLKLCRAVVFPSYLRSEAFGITLLEGAMYGKPLISTEVGSGTSHVNVDGTNGIVVSPGNPEALRHAMNQLHQRPDLAELLGRRSRERYLKLFTASLMGHRYFQLYGELVENAPPVAERANG